MWGVSAGARLDKCKYLKWLNFIIIVCVWRWFFWILNARKNVEVAAIAHEYSSPIKIYFEQIEEVQGESELS